MKMGNLNRLIPVDLYYNIRFLQQRVTHRRMFKDENENKTVWFLDAPDYGNLGDQAIAYATKKFLNDMLPEAKLIEVQESNLVANLSALKKSVKPNDLIVLQGGGNMGNLYPRYEWMRRLVIRNFPNTKIIVFPQSIYFTQDKYGIREQQVSAKVYRNHKKLIIFARDSKSQKKMREAFPEVDVRLSPDIVLYLVGIVLEEHKENLGICIRNDLESTVSESLLNELVQSIGYREQDTGTLSTTVDIQRPIDENTREFYVINKLKEFAKYKLVVTDRLHGMVFSYITGTPCIAIDNQTGKSSALYKDWLSNSKLVTIFNNEFSIEKTPQLVKPDKVDFSELENSLM